MKHANSRRSMRLSDQILREIARLLEEEVLDPRLELVTVSGVTLNSDITVAEVFITYANTEDKRADVEAALAKAKGFIRTRVAKTLNLKKTPELRFRFDQFLEDMVYDHPGE